MRVQTNASIGLPSSPTYGPCDVLDSIALRPFLQADFNKTEFASRILRNPGESAKGRTSELSEAARNLDSAIRAEVISKQDDLLSHARQLQVSEKSLQRIKTSIAGLSETAQRLKKDVKEPFDVVQRQVTQLGNLHKAMEVLRVVNHRLKQTAKLRQIMVPDKQLEPMDMAKSAKIIWEIEAAAPEETVFGVAIVERCVLLAIRLPVHTFPRVELHSLVEDNNACIGSGHAHDQTPKSRAKHDVRAWHCRATAA